MSVIVVSVIQTLKVLFVVVNWIHNWWFVCCFWLIIHVITKVSYYLFLFVYLWLLCVLKSGAALPGMDKKKHRFSKGTEKVWVPIIVDVAFVD